MKNKKKGVKKMILSILGILLLIIIVAVGVVVSIVSSSNKVNDPEEVILQGGEKKAILIYEPSKSSLSSDVSLKTAETLKDEGYTVTVNYPSDKLNYNLNDYDVIVFGSPVYAGQVSKVLENYIKDNPIENKKVIVYSVGSNSKEKNEVDNLKSFVGSKNEIYGGKYTKDTEEEFYNFIKDSVN